MVPRIFFFCRNSAELSVLLEVRFTKGCQTATAAAGIQNNFFRISSYEVGEILFERNTSFRQFSQQNDGWERVKMMNENGVYIRKSYDRTWYGM
jgi:hypothetical protein